jgi:hypothetical protein
MESAWDFLDGMLYDQSMHIWHPLLLTLQDEIFLLDQSASLLAVSTPPANTCFCGGFLTLGAFAAGLHRSYLPQLSCRLVLPLFPWDLGKHLIYDSPTKAVSTLADLSRRVRVQADGLEIKLTYKSFNITAIVLLATSENPCP